MAELRQSRASGFPQRTCWPGGLVIAQQCGFAHEHMGPVAGTDMVPQKCLCPQFWVSLTVWSSRSGSYVQTRDSVSYVFINGIVGHCDGRSSLQWFSQGLALNPVNNYLPPSSNAGNVSAQFHSDSTDEEPQNHSQPKGTCTKFSAPWLEVVTWSPYLGHMGMYDGLDRMARLCFIKYFTENS